MSVFRFKMIAILFVSFLLLAACGNDTGQQGEDTETDSNQQEDNLSYRDELNIALTAQPPTLDTAQTVSAVALDIAGNVYQQLFQLDASYEPTPVLAESYEVSEDGTAYTIYLREGVHFHNGEEMTAEDVVASMNRWLVTSSRAIALLEGASFSEIDPYTVQLDVPEATSDVLILMASQAQFPSIMPKEIIESITEENGLSEYIGTGPYKFEEWRQDQHISLVRNEDYQSLEGAPSGFTGEITTPTERLVFHFVSDHSTRIAGIQTGLYDVADTIPIDSYDQLDADDNIELLTFPGGTLTAFFNTTEGIFADEALRHAVLAALDNEEIMLASYSKPELFELAPGYLSDNHEQWSTDAGAEYYNQANPELAQQLLDEAGYNGEEITLLTTQDYNEMYTGTLVIQDQLRQIGMNVTVDTYDFPTFLETKDSRGEWDLFLASTGYQITPPQLLAVTPDWAGLDDDFVREGLANIRGAQSPEEASAAWATVQEHLYETSASTVLGHYNSVVAVRSELEDFELFEAPVVWNARIPE
ncbi:peptide/nickel transport system substrate-binding protein [Amphibacillus marinus]|uniref:Peptide/nickel transport system substrate-binding protein n=1 Tax=Amphibacillus marinus TaxID=872970 RepID=A0A1H8M366_9BACI|nr:ABC transporter substrate-binding protein [Amphibacillus marinus]SEO11720.1 peptide/nickel transport system substrate-binding protein [Amphibacillus marinus]